MTIVVFITVVWALVLFSILVKSFSFVVADTRPVFEPGKNMVQYHLNFDRFNEVVFFRSS